MALLRSLFLASFDHQFRINDELAGEGSNCDTRRFITGGPRSIMYY